MSEMHTLESRCSAIFAFTLLILACSTFVCFLSTITIDNAANATLNTVKVFVKNVPDYSASREMCDLGFITFDLQANLTHLFNWNVKQLFLYLIAEYSSPNNIWNQVVLWDKIIQRGENAQLNLKNMNTKYFFLDDGNGLKSNTNVTLNLFWDVMPNSGIFQCLSANGHHFKFPTEYTTEFNFYKS